MSHDSKVLFNRRTVTIVLACAALCAVITAALSWFVLPKQYQAHVSMIIVRDPNTDQSDLYSDLQAGLALIKDYREIIKTDAVLRQVKNDLGNRVPDLKNLPNKDIRKKITFDSTTDSRVFTVIYQDPDPKVAQIVADKLALVLKQKVGQLLKVDTIAILAMAELPEEPSSPDMVVNTSLGFILGLVISSLLIVLLDYWRNLE